MSVTDDTGETLLCIALLQYLAGEDPELASWDANAAYAATWARPAGFIMNWPDKPDRAIMLTPYPISADPDQAQMTTGVQVRTRWAGANPRAVLNYRAAVYDELEGLANITLPGGVAISQCLHQSGASMGQDGSQRWGWSDNYYVDWSRPSRWRS